MIQVMVVDDVAVFRQVTRMMVEREPDLEVVAEAATCAEAVARFDRARPDLVLIDVELPDGTGFATFKKLRAIDPEVRGLMVTAGVDWEGHDEALRVGASGCLLKPVNAALLVQEVRRAMAEPAPRGEGRPPAPTAPRTSRGRVLVVDDEPVTRELLSRMVHDAGAEVVATAGTAPGAWRLYEQHRPDLVLLDLGLGAGHGLDVLARIRAADPGAPVVIVTGDARTATARQALQLGATNYLLKPLERSRCVAVIQASLQAAGVVCG